ncbi:MAG: hypothetical protein H7A25_08815 [Leptospiraceae bacterium]|nr:hypothetical protein [Leptospiraceae bacterium]
MYFSAINLSLLGMVFSYFTLYKYSDISGKFSFYLLLIEYVIILNLSLFSVIKPLDGGWKLLSNSDSYSDPILYHTEDGLFIHGSVKGRIFVKRYNEQEGFDDLAYPGLFSWELKDKNRQLWFGPKKGNHLYLYKLDEKKWYQMIRPGGYVRSLAFLGDTTYLVVRNRLYQMKGYGDWKEVYLDNYVSSACVDTKNQIISVSGKKFHLSVYDSSQWIDHTPSGKSSIHYECISLSDSFYFYHGGLLFSEIWEVKFKKTIKKIKSPVRDIRIIVPIDKKRLVVGTWGEGVYVFSPETEDWEYLGLKGVEVRSMAYDEKRKILYAASSNLFNRKGIYFLSLE